MGKNDVLAGYLTGGLLAPDRSAEIHAKTDATVARTDAAIAEDRAETAGKANIMLAVAVHNARQEAAVAVEEKNNWRKYANRLNAHLTARKMSESDLLDALKEQNINHPLATKEGFEEQFKKHLAAQYQEFDTSENPSAAQKSLREVGKGREDVT